MLTKKEQKQFEDMFDEVLKEGSDKLRMEKLADIIFEMTGDVNLRMGLHTICERVKGALI